MGVQEAVQWMLANGFEDITAMYNSENQSHFAFVFFHPHEGPRGLRCFCEKDRDILGLPSLLDGMLGRD